MCQLTGSSRLTCRPLAELVARGVFCVSLTVALLPSAGLRHHFQIGWIRLIVEYRIPQAIRNKMAHTR